MTVGKFDDAAKVWNERFSAPQFVFGTQPNAWLARKAHLLKPGQCALALAVADVEGRNSVWPAGQGLRVDAFDISFVGVDKARKLARDAGVEVNYGVSDCDGWDWKEGAYDMAAAIVIQFADPVMRSRLLRAEFASRQILELETYVATLHEGALGIAQA